MSKPVGRLPEQSPRFKRGDVVILSKDGRQEIPSLRRKRGVVIGDGLTSQVFIVDWGRAKTIMHNHQDNLELLNGASA